MTITPMTWSLPREPGLSAVSIELCRLYCIFTLAGLQLELLSHWVASLVSAIIWVPFLWTIKSSLLCVFLCLQPWEVKALCVMDSWKVYWKGPLGINSGWHGAHFSHSPSLRITDLSWFFFQCCGQFFQMFSPPCRAVTGRKTNPKLTIS